MRRNGKEIISLLIVFLAIVATVAAEGKLEKNKRQEKDGGDGGRGRGGGEGGGGQEGGKEMTLVWEGKKTDPVNYNDSNGMANGNDNKKNNNSRICNLEYRLI